MRRDWRELLKFRCTGCGNCCHETVVCITDADVRRIVEATGRSAREFVRFFSDEEVEMDKRSPLWVAFDKGRALMALRWSRGHCIFLDRENLCMIYESRPLTCRQYPFNVELSETGGIERLSLARAAKCLHDWDGRVTRRSLHSVLKWSDQQERAYIRKVREWNRCRSGPKTRPRFLRFLGLVEERELPKATTSRNSAAVNTGRLRGMVPSASVTDHPQPEAAARWLGSRRTIPRGRHVGWRGLP